MKKLGLKLIGAALSILLINVAFASEYETVSTNTPSKESALTPGARLIAGLPGKNDFYILDRQEKMPTELTQNTTNANKAQVTINNALPPSVEKAQIGSQKAPAGAAVTSMKKSLSHKNIKKVATRKTASKHNVKLSVHKSAAHKSLVGKTVTGKHTLASKRAHNATKRLATHAATKTLHHKATTKA